MDVTIATIDGNEFGYNEYVGVYHTTYQGIVFNEKEEKWSVLCYEDSPGEITEAIIEEFIKKGFNFDGWEFEGKPDFIYKES